MKSALVRITAKALSRLLGIPDGACVDAVFQDAVDHADDSFSMRIRGVGEEATEGTRIRYLTLREITDPEKDQG